MLAIERSSGFSLFVLFQDLPCRSAGVAQLVEHHVANVVVVGSNPITRS
jgi:hypothetical protein